MAGQAARLGFTLAEVLVTLGIIGVISAMTLPTLVKNHQRTVYVTQLHKVYNELSQAFSQVITDSNAVNLRESQFSRNGSEWFLRNYFKTTKMCDENSLADCFADEYKNLNGDTIRVITSVGCQGDKYASILSSGASIMFTCIPAGVIIVDVNGKQGPNILGRDLFDFEPDINGNLLAYGDIETIASNFSTECSTANASVTYGACFARILNDGWKMDY